MKQYYRSAVEHGGDQITIALGKAERLLKLSPKNSVARAYKGSLLAMISPTMLERQSGIYLRNGITMMQDVLRTLDAKRFDDIEAYFVTVTNLLRLAEVVPEAAIPAMKLDALLVPDRLALLTQFEKITVLVLAAQIATKADDSTRAAALIEEAMAYDIGLTTLIRSHATRPERGTNLS